VAWNPPEYVDLDEVIEVAEEMGYLPDRSGQEHIDYLREDTDVTVMGTPERVRSFFNPQAETWTEPMYPAMDMPGGPLHTPLDPDDEWTRHIAVLVSNLAHVLPGFEDPYEGSGALDFPDLVRLEVYNQIMGFRNAPQLRRHLFRSNARHDFPVHKVLGLDSIPHQNTIRDAQQERFGPGASEFIARWARRIEVIGLKRGYRFPDVDEKRLSNNGGITEVPIERKRGYAQGALDIGRDNMPISKAEDISTWTDYGIHFDFSLHLCDTGGAPEAELENFADNRGLQKGVGIFKDAETFRNDIYRPDIYEWVSTINQWTDALLDAVYPMELRSRGVPIAIDTTNIPTWTNETSDVAGVLGTEKMDNTHYAYRIFTAQAVSDGMPFQLAHALQMTPKNRPRRLMGLLDEVEGRGFDIGLLMADSEFAPGEVVNEIKNRGLNFIIQVPNDWVSKYTDDFEDQNKTFGVVDEYTMNEGKGKPKETTNTLFCSYEHLWSSTPKTVAETDNDDDEDDPGHTQRTLTELASVEPEPEYVNGRQDAETGKVIREEAAEEREEGEQIDFGQKNAGWLTYITNIDANEAEARTLREYYKYRWSIESSYGDFKETFLPKTKSTELALRTHLYLYGMFAYNAWIAANVKCRRQHLQDSERNRPPIRARRFTTIGQQRYRTDEFPIDYINFSED